MKCIWALVAVLFAGAALAVTLNYQVVSPAPSLGNGTPFTVSGCGTAGTIRANAVTGTFVVGTGASTCTFTITPNGAAGATAATGWIAIVDDVTAKIHCPPNGTIASTTTAVALCNSTVTTGDLITVHLEAF